MRAFLLAILLAVALLASGRAGAVESLAPGELVATPAVAAARAPTMPMPVSSVAVGPAIPANQIDWLHVLTKTLTYETMSSVLETGLFLAFYGGTAHTAGGVFLVALASASAVYIAHEYLWEAALPPDFDRADPALVSAKTVGYRILSTARSFILGTVLGGAGAAASGGFAVSMAVLDSGLYALTEFAFARLRPFPLEQ